MVFSLRNMLNNCGSESAKVGEWETARRDWIYKLLPWCVERAPAVPRCFHSACRLRRSQVGRDGEGNAASKASQHVHRFAPCAHQDPPRCSSGPSSGHDKRDPPGGYVIWCSQGIRYQIRRLREAPGEVDVLIAVGCWCCCCEYSRSWLR